MGKRVLYIEKEKFLRSMMELALRAKDAEIHTVETLQDHLYLLDALKPQLIIFDLETCSTNPEELEQLLAFSAKAKLIATGSPEFLKNLDKRVSGSLEKPLVAHTLALRVLSLVD